MPMTATLTDPGTRVVGAVVPDARRPDCVKLLVEGGTFLTVPRQVAERERIVPGVRLEPALLERLCRAADAEAAYRTGLRFLEHRPFGARDLCRRLVLKGHPPEAAEAARARLEGMGLLDDARFALGYVQTRSTRGRGPLRLRRDLAAMGVERKVVDAALLEAFGPEGAEAPRPDGLARRRLAQLKGLPRPVQRRRLLAYLARRGFAGAEVSRMVGELLKWGGPGAAEPDTTEEDIA
jgi:regulatory protein